jgi:hypothetical protein
LLDGKGNLGQSQVLSAAKMLQTGSMDLRILLNEASADRLILFLLPFLELSLALMSRSPLFNESQLISDLPVE